MAESRNLNVPLDFIVSPPELDVLVPQHEYGEYVSGQPEEADQGHEDGLHHPLEHQRHGDYDQFSR